MGSNTEKKPWTNLQKSYKNFSKEIKSDNFCYRKVGRAITKWGAIEKSWTYPISLFKDLIWLEETERMDIIISAPMFDNQRNI